MALPLVSVVTPSLNQGQFIEEAIRSVRGQSYPRVEHIVVDGGSIDETIEIVERYSHLTWVSESDRGQADAVNKGFRLAQGQYFGWLNADDVYLPGAIEAAVAALDETGAGLVYGGWHQIDEGGSLLREVEPFPFDYTELRDGRNTIAQPAAFFTRAAFEAVGGLDPRYHYAMDYDLWLKIAAEHPVAVVERPLAAFRFHSGSKTVSAADRFWPETRKVSRRHGGALLTPPHLDYLSRRWRWFRVLRNGYALVRRRDFRGIVRRAGLRTLGR